MVSRNQPSSNNSNFTCRAHFLFLIVLSPVAYSEERLQGRLHPPRIIRRKNIIAHSGKLVGNILDGVVECEMAQGKIQFFFSSAVKLTRIPSRVSYFASSGNSFDRIIFKYRQKRNETVKCISLKSLLYLLNQL